MDRLFDDARPRRRAWAVIAVLLAAIGAINWGMVGLTGVDLVAAVFGDHTRGTRLIHAAIGLAGLVALLALPRLLRR